MNEKAARAEFDSWLAAQIMNQSSKPGREMLEALRDSEVEMSKPGDCVFLGVKERTTFGEVARRLLAEHYGAAGV